MKPKYRREPLRLHDDDDEVVPFRNLHSDGENMVRIGNTLVPTEKVEKAKRYIQFGVFRADVTGAFSKVLPWDSSDEECGTKN